MLEKAFIGRKALIERVFFRNFNEILNFDVNSLSEKLLKIKRIHSQCIKNIHRVI